MAFKPIQNLQDATATGKNGSVKITWNAGALPRINGVLSKKQEIIDSEVLRLCSPWSPSGPERWRDPARWAQSSAPAR